MHKMNAKYLVNTYTLPFPILKANSTPNSRSLFGDQTSSARSSLAIIFGIMCTLVPKNKNRKLQRIHTERQIYHKVILYRSSSSSSRSTCSNSSRSSRGRRSSRSGRSSSSSSSNKSIHNTRQYKLKWECLFLCP